MGKIHLGVLAFSACAAMLAGCQLADRLAERPVTCNGIAGATRVTVVIYSQGNSEYVITDSDRIRQLTSFANARLDVARPSLYTMPAPQTNAIFYDKTDFLGSIGAGTNFFFVSCRNEKGVRSASEAELAEFKRLIGPAK